MRESRVRGTGRVHRAAGRLEVEVARLTRPLVGHEGGEHVVQDGTRQRSAVEVALREREVVPRLTSPRGRSHPVAAGGRVGGVGSRASELGEHRFEVGSGAGGALRRTDPDRRDHRVEQPIECGGVPLPSTREVHGRAVRARARVRGDVDHRDEVTPVLGRPRHPAEQDLLRDGPRPGQLERRHGGRRDGAQPEAGADAEVPAAAAAQRPEGIRFVPVVTPHHTSVGQHDLGSDQPVQGQPFAARPPAHPAAPDHAPHGHRPAQGAGQGASVRRQRGVGVHLQRARSDVGEIAVAAHRAEHGGVHDQTGRGRVPGVAVPAAAGSQNNAVPLREPRRGHDVGGVGRVDHGLRADVVELCEGQLARHRVVAVGRQDQVTVQRPPQRLPVPRRRPHGHRGGRERHGRDCGHPDTQHAASSQPRSRTIHRLPISVVGRSTRISDRR